MGGGICNGDLGDRVMQVRDADGFFLTKVHDHLRILYGTLSTGSN